MSFLSGNLTAILLKTKKSSDSLSQQNAKENNSQTAFVIEVRLDIKKIIEKYENNIQPIVPKKITTKVCKERKSRNSLRLEIPEIA